MTSFDLSVECDGFPRGLALADYPQAWGSGRGRSRAGRAGRRGRGGIGGGSSLWCGGALLGGVVEAGVRPRRSPVPELRRPPADRGGLPRWPETPRSAGAPGARRSVPARRTRPVRLTAGSAAAPNDIMLQSRNLSRLPRHGRGAWASSDVHEPLTTLDSALRRRHSAWRQRGRERGWQARPPPRKAV